MNEPKVLLAKQIYWLELSKDGGRTWIVLSGSGDEDLGYVQEHLAIRSKHSDATWRIVGERTERSVVSEPRSAEEKR